MGDMRLIVAGAGGRMGRTLVKAIAETKGLTLAGAVDAPGSAVIGRDAGERRIMHGNRCHQTVGITENAVERQQRETGRKARDRRMRRVEDRAQERQ